MMRAAYNLVGRPGSAGPLPETNAHDFLRQITGKMEKAVSASLAGISVTHRGVRQGGN